MIRTRPEFPLGYRIYYYRGYLAADIISIIMGEI
jgi:hypothetical protein